MDAAFLTGKHDKHTIPRQLTHLKLTHLKTKQNKNTRKMSVPHREKTADLSTCNQVGLVEGERVWGNTPCGRGDARRPPSPHSQEGRVCADSPFSIPSEGGRHFCCLCSGFAMKKKHGDHQDAAVALGKIGGGQCAAGIIGMRLLP